MAQSRLETFRRKIQKLTSEAGSLYDYLDRGRPNHEEHLRAHSRITEIEELLKPLLEQYNQKAERLAQKDPDAFSLWCQRHESTTLQMEKETDDSTARFVARQTREKWQKFRKGNYQWFSINSYFLRGYDRVYDSLDASAE